MYVVKKEGRLLSLWKKDTRGSKEARKDRWERVEEKGTEKVKKET